MSEIIKYISKLAVKESLTEDEAVRAFQIIMKGGATPAQIAAILVGLRIKGETIDELTGAAKVLRSRALRIEAPDNAIDTCGTGGDYTGSYNISTAVGFVVAGCGVPVAKHGNRSVTSKSGSAEVLTELGINIEADKEVMQRALYEANICFLMAPKFHLAMRHVAPTRQELGIRTIFNLVGPLANPALVKYHLLGVFSKDLLEPMAKVLNKLGCKRAWIVCGEDGMDEITTTTITHVVGLADGKLESFTVNPEDYGIRLVDVSDLKGGGPAENALELRRVISGAKNCNKAYKDAVLLNASACLVIAGKASDLQEGIKMASDSIDSGQAMQALSRLMEISGGQEEID